MSISPLGFGGNILGHFTDAAGSASLLSAAGDLGINFIDTADVYSDGVSEEHIGAALRGRRDRWVVATKLGSRSHEPYAGSARPDAISSRLEASLRRLRTDYVDLYQLHHWDPATSLDDVIAALDKAVRQGKIRHFGVSNFTGPQLSVFASRCREAGCVAPVSIQAGYNLLKREAEEDILPACRDNGIAFIAYGALARGVLSGKYKEGVGLPADSRAAGSAAVRADLSADVLSAAGAVERFATARGLTAVTVALAWVLARPEVGAVLVGARTAAQWKEAAKALEVKLSEADRRELDAAIGDLERFKDKGLGRYPVGPRSGENG